VKIEEKLKAFTTERVKTNQILEEVRAMLHAKTIGSGKNCSLTNSKQCLHNKRYQQGP